MNNQSDDTASRASATTLERSYGVPFRAVWEAAISVGSTLRGWQVNERDSRAGTMRLATVDRFGYRPLEAAVRMWLDELGQTRIEIAVEEARHPLIPPSGASRIRRFFRDLDRKLAVGGGS